jgi:hypothetical protein
MWIASFDIGIRNFAFSIISIDNGNISCGEMEYKEYLASYIFSKSHFFLTNFFTYFLHECCSTLFSNTEDSHTLHLRTLFGHYSK